MTRFLTTQGARVTITDLRDEQELAESIEGLSDLTIDKLRLGKHCEEDFREADLIIVNPAVRPSNRFVEIARQSGATITSEIELFLEYCPARVIGVTGTNGKSTTAAMIAATLKSDGLDVHLGGNIECSLLPRLDEMTSVSWCVLELSSFQLYWLSDAARRCDVAVITNCAANHLDWHDDYIDYRDAKRKILLANGSTTDANEQRVFDPTGALGPTTCDLTGELDSLPPLHAIGQHNQQNAALAAVVAQNVGCSAAAIDNGLRNFRPLPHRLETIARYENRTFVNDSQATTPESTIAALEATGPHCWLLAGGADKGADLSAMAESVCQNAAGAAFFGQLGPSLLAAVKSIDPNFAGQQFERLPEAFCWCVGQSSSGDTVLLSPGCASLDQYRDYAERAAEFRDCIDVLISEPPAPDLGEAAAGTTHAI